MCREIVITYDGCRHEASDKKLCLAAEREIAKAQKRTTWCCIAVKPPKRRVVCEVEYKPYRQAGFCEHCKAARRREQARQVRAFRAQSQERARADQLARDRQRQEKIKEAEAREEARAKARQAAERYEWEARAAQRDHGDSFIENPLYKQVMDLLSGPEYQEYMPPPAKSSARQATGRGREPCRSKLQSRTPAPVAETRVQEWYSGRKPRDSNPATGSVHAPAPARVRAPVTLPVPGVGMVLQRKQMAVAGLPQLRVVTDGGVHSKNKVVQHGGHTVPLLKQRQEQMHEPVDDYGEPMTDDEFLDFVERS
ncbi:hypothetical protein NKR19_g2314 [Coniochaeta hoffmannii]|uniref:Uncharacterized protein n=1 Tax=Coniochaeta hoffmannii TaxID=91930 RepID=A0AA38VZ75_9PEZI|nr:hypothetical protein NKR19_g2314 [Coniochaeta hoffmannii]